MKIENQSYKEMEKECDERLLKAIQEFSEAFSLFSFSTYNEVVND